MEKPNDRLKRANLAAEDPEPKIYLVVNNQKFARPGLETYYAVGPSATGTPSTQSSCSCNPVGAVYCSCNKVCTCNPLCTCLGVSTCSCVSHRSSSGGTYCSCVPVH